MGNLRKLGILVLVVFGLGAAGWLYLEKTGNSEQANRAANAVMGAADRAIDAARAGDRFEETEEENYVNVGAIFTANGNVAATLIVRGTDGVEAVCNRMAFVRDYLVGMLSDYPPDSRNLSAGPVGYPGSIRSGINDLIEFEAVQRVRYDSFRLGQTGASPSC